MPSRRAFLSSASAVLFSGSLQQTPSNGAHCEDHIQWVSKVLIRMQTIMPGMIRKTLLTVFTTEGGLSTPMERTFVSRDCLFFKVNVRFRTVGAPDQNGRASMQEDDNDVITSISDPYLQFFIAD